MIILHWLPSAKYLFINGHLPINLKPILNNAQPDYPYARALIHAIVNSINKNFSSDVQGLFNVLMPSSVLLWGPLALERSNYTKNNIHFAYPILFLSGVLFFLIISLGPKF